MTLSRKIVYANLDETVFLRPCSFGSQYFKTLNCSIEDVAKECKKSKIHMSLILKSDHPYIEDAINKKIFTSCISSVLHNSEDNYYDVITNSGTWYRLLQK